MSTPSGVPAALLDVDGIEVIYHHVILVLKGVSLTVPEGAIVALLGGNGAGKTTTLRAVSNLLAGERGEVTKGRITLRGRSTPVDICEPVPDLADDALGNMRALMDRLAVGDGYTGEFGVHG